MMKVVVSGGTGHIGRLLVQDMIGDGVRCINYDAGPKRNLAHHFKLIGHPEISKKDWISEENQPKLR